MPDFGLAAEQLVERGLQETLHVAEPDLRVFRHRSGPARALRSSFPSASAMIGFQRRSIVALSSKAFRRRARRMRRPHCTCPPGNSRCLIAAAVLVGAGFVQLWKAATCSFLRHLDARAQRPLAIVARAARLCGARRDLPDRWLAAGARGLDHSAAEAGGLEQALDALRGPLQFPVAAGLALFGFYSLVEARFRSIHKPPTEHIKRKVEETCRGLGNDRQIDRARRSPRRGRRSASPSDSRPAFA